MTQNLALDTAARIQKVCALGTGTMGPGVALDFALADRDVMLYGRFDESLAKANFDLDRDLGTYVAQKIITPQRAAKVKARITMTTSMEDALREADFVLESLFESMEVKHENFAKVNVMAPAHAILATNTSALPPTEIAKVLSPERQKNFVVTHGFNPFNLMPAVEVAPGIMTSALTMDATCHLMEMIGKKPVRLECESPGFIVNYIQASIIRAGLELFLSGRATPQQIDSAFKDTLGVMWADKGPLESSGHLGIVAAGKLAFKRLTGHGHDEEIVHHMQSAALTAAHWIVNEGIASVEQVDKAYKYSLGMRYGKTGPLESADMGGLDIFLSIFKTVGFLKEETDVTRYLSKMVADNMLGVKKGDKPGQGCGRGIYEWPPEHLAALRSARESVLFDFLRKNMKSETQLAAMADVPVEALTPRPA